MSRELELENKYFALANELNAANAVIDRLKNQLVDYEQAVSNLEEYTQTQALELKELEKEKFQMAELYESMLNRIGSIVEEIEKGPFTRIRNLSLEYGNKDEGHDE